MKRNRLAFGDGRGAGFWTIWPAHALATVAGVMLVAAAWGWITGGAEVVGERTGLEPDSPTATALALQLGLYKGLLDICPLPLALLAAVRGAHGFAAAVWFLAVMMIPMTDLGVAVATGGAIALHLPFLVVMGGAAIAYLRVANQPKT